MSRNNYFKFLCLLGVLQVFALHAFAQQELSSDEYYKLARIEGNQKGNYRKAANLCRKGLEIEPGDMDLRQYLGKCYLELKMYDSSRYELKKVVDKFPRNVDARHYLINVEYQTGRYSSAICYINELLEVTPYWKGLWLKKIAIYNEMGNKVESKRALTRLYSIFPEDSMVKRYYRDMISEEADKYAKTGDYKMTKDLYDRVLTVEPTDLKTIQKQVNLELKAGKKNTALELTEIGLSNYPYDPILIMKKIGLLQELRMFPEAIMYIEGLLKKYPSATLRNTLNELKLESARYYNNTDPYVLYQKVYASSPGNQEAFTFLLNNALSKGYYDDAQEYLSSALKRNPGSKDLLLKQMSLYEKLNKTTEANKTLEKLATKFPGDGDIREKYATLLLQQGKSFFQDQLYAQAEPIFQKLARTPGYSELANEYIFSIYAAQKNYPQALNQINSMISRYPSNEEYVVKKSSILEEMGRFDEAMEISNTLSQRNPGNERFKNIYVSQSVPFIKQLLENEKYDSALVIVEDVLSQDPKSMQAYEYGINANSAKGNLDGALSYCERGLSAFPEHKELSIKKAGLLSEKKDHFNAIQELEILKQRYPYNQKIKGSLAEAYFMQGKVLEKRNQPDSAFQHYVKSLENDPKDTFALYRIVNIEIESKAYEIAKFYTEAGLSQYPDNQPLLYKKGILHELLQNYDSAYHFIKLAEPAGGGNKEYLNYLDYLYAKRYKNQIGIQFTRSFFDSTQFKSAIAALEYTRFEKRNTYTYRFYYAARPVGTGVQNELEWFHKINPKLYTQANIAVANQFAFPKFRISGSVFKLLKSEYELEAGLRYVLQRNNIGLLSGIGGVSREWNDVWVNLRGFIMTDFSKMYSAVTLQSRYYLNYRNDYFMIIGSLGTPPEEKTLDFQLNTFLTYVTRMVGAGYQHKIKHRTTIGLQGNWFNFRVAENYNVNQYNIFITLMTLF